MCFRKAIRDYSLKMLEPLLTRPFTVLNADGEVFVSLDTPAEDYNYSLDPTVLKYVRGILSRHFALPLLQAF